MTGFTGFLNPVNRVTVILFIMLASSFIPHKTDTHRFNRHTCSRRRLARVSKFSGEVVPFRFTGFLFPLDPVHPVILSKKSLTLPKPLNACGTLAHSDGSLQDQHRIAIAIEAIALRDGFAVGAEDGFAPCKRTHQNEQ